MAKQCEEGKLTNIAGEKFSSSLVQPEYFKVLEAGTAQEKIISWRFFEISNVVIRY